MYKKAITHTMAIGIIFSASLLSAMSLSKPEGMYDLYRQNRSQKIPNFITIDFVMQSYALLYEDMVSDIETNLLQPAFSHLVETLLTDLALESSDKSEVKLAQNFMTMLSILLHEDATEAQLSEPFSTELKLIRDAKGIVFSPLLHQKLDYSRFQVRGKYAESPQLARWFLAWNYASTPLFYLNHSEITGVTSNQADLFTRTAIYLSHMLEERPDNKIPFEKIARTCAQLFGPQDGPSSKDYLCAERENITKVRACLSERFFAEGKEPRLVTVPFEGPASDFSPGLITGWRFMPQPYMADSAAQCQLVFPNVGQFQGKRIPFSATVANGRVIKGFPLAAELLTLLDNSNAQSHLNKEQETNFQGYEAAKAKALTEIRNARGLPAMHLNLLRLWGTKAPMQSPAAFWTRLRHTNKLFQISSYTMIPKGLAPSRPAVAVLEKDTDLYIYLLSTIHFLDELNPNEKVREFGRIIKRLSLISQKETLPLDDINFLNNLDLIIANIIETDDLPVVVDVHTDLNSRMVLQEGVGWPGIVHKTINGVKARGARFSHKEFKQPMDQKLTNSAWREKLREEALEFSNTVSILSCNEL